VPLYRGTRYALLAAGGLRRPAIPPTAVSGTEEAAEGETPRDAGPADHAEPHAGVVPAEPIRGILGPAR
jgi:hypothetical protein